ncbi:MAG: RidA family protein [bacterium]|jgi:2-iminobutanoate/2-iminopropanoate deaminase
MDKEIVSTTKAPAAIGPYSQAVKAGGFLFVSGQIPLVPETGELVLGDIKEQAERVLDNINAILGAAGTSFDRVIKTTIFLTDMGNFAAVNEVYSKYFPTNPPARACVAVAQLPRGVAVEIEAIALCA